MWTSGAATVGTTYLFLHPEVLGLPEDTDWKLLGHAIIRGLKLAATVVLIVSDYQAPKLLAFLGISGYVGWMDDPCRALEPAAPCGGGRVEGALLTGQLRYSCQSLCAAGCDD